MELELIENTIDGSFDVRFNGVSLGMIVDDFEVGHTFHAIKQHKLTGDHYIAVGELLNKINEVG